MTIEITAAKDALLAAAGTANNPIIAWDNYVSYPTTTLSTVFGTETASVDFVATGTTYDAWTATTTAATNIGIEIDFGVARIVNFIGIAAHDAADNYDILFIQSSTDAITWVNEGSLTLVDNQAAGIYFADVFVRYWRVAFTNSAGPIALAHLFIGPALELPRRQYQGTAPPLTPNKVSLLNNVSEGNHLLGNVTLREGSMGSSELTNIDPTFFRGDIWLRFQNAFNTGRGFLYAWRPTKYGDLFYGWRSGRALAPENTGPRDLMGASMSMEFYDDP